MAKILLVTGASKGIGLATATHFLQQGYKIVNLSRTPCELNNVINLKVDLGQLDWREQHGADIENLVKDAEQITLLHNAAIMTKDTVQDIDAQALRFSLQVNVVAAAELNTLVLPFMHKGSSIIYISSTLGTKAVANTHAYVVSKHAVIGQMRASCQDLVGSQIHTAAICPGFTETEMLKEHLGSNPELREQINSTIVLGRLVQPTEIAEAVWFCSQNSSVNGTVLHVNNGQVER